jgi:hypothetical protein
MVASAPQRPVVRLLLELHPAPEGRLEGRVGTPADDSWASFSGVLELLKVIEDTLSVTQIAVPNLQRKDPSHEVQS